MTDVPTGPSADRLAAAFDAIDRANADDPNTIVVDGTSRPKEQAHAELMTAWVRRLDPEADDAQLLAARAHHLRRWTIPRAGYDDGRRGYLRWRTDLKKQHARDVAEILTACGYEPMVIERVQKIIRKEGLGSDPAVQTHEDALCLVFLETQFQELLDKIGEERLIEVLQKTIAKMSEDGRARAVELPLSDSQRTIVERALIPSG